jgi:glycine hydroxymethyltransferase
MVTQKGLDKDPEMAKKIDRAVFPGLQGGPHNNQTAAIAVALEEASSDSFKDYGNRVVENAKVLSGELIKHGFNLVSGGTDNHLMLIDLRNKNISGKDAAVRLEEAGIITNCNSIPGDPNPPMNPSGLRIGTPAVTTRGMGTPEMIKIAGMMDKVISNTGSVNDILQEVKGLCKKFPIPQ